MNSILLHGNIILRLPNWVLDRLYVHMGTIIHDKKIYLNKNMTDFFDQLDQDVYGSGLAYVDLGDYFEDKSDELSLFISIFDDAVVKAVSEDVFTEPALQLFLNFRNKLTEYLQSMQEKA